ncbi:MAG: pilus assembly protein PilM [Armatimonadota bacterium]
MLGLDIGSRAIYLVRYANGQVLAFGQCPTPPESVVDGIVVDPQRVAEAILRLQRLMRLRESTVCLAIGGAHVVNKWVEVPCLPLEELNRSAPLEAPRHLPPSREPMLYRFWVPPNIHPSGDTMPARLIAITQAAVHSRLDTALLAGLTPVGVVPEADALVRVLTRHHRPHSLLWRGKATALVAIRYDYTEMSIARETHLEFTRTLRIGLEDAIEAVQRALGASFEEAESLLQQSQLDEHGTLHFPDTLGLPPISLLGFLHQLTSEMRRLVDFQRSRFPEGSYLGLLDSFLITGEGAILGGLIRYCSQNLGLTCLLGDLLSALKWRVEVQDRRPEEMGRYVSALGAVLEYEADRGDGESEPLEVSSQLLTPAKEVQVA